MIRRVFTMPDRSQLLVQSWLDGDVVRQTIATRPHSSATWGPPVRETYADDDATPEYGLSFSE